MTQSTAFKTEWDKLFIGGKWVEPSTAEVIEVHSPGHRRAGRQGAAGGARPTSTPPAPPRARPSTRARGRTCRRRSAPPCSAPPSSCMEERADELKFLLAAETGQPPTIVDMMQYGAAMSAFQYYAGAADKFTWRDFRDGVYGQTMVLREPIGVVGAVTAWNVPFFLAANKLGPALLAGCTIVRQAGRRDAAVAVRDGGDLRRGRPARGCAVGRARRPGDRARADRQPRDRQVHVHRQSARSARRSRKIAAEKLKPCSLELGGKSAAIILEDADLDSTLPMLVFSGLMNCGQACVGQTRILAPRSRYDEVVEKLSAGGRGACRSGCPTTLAR